MERVRMGDFFARQGWYPADPAACARQVAAYREGAADLDLPDALPGRAGVVPHAGWVFSGQLAALTFASLTRAAPETETVVLFGGHLGPRAQPWVLARGAWPTPLGNVPTDEALAEALAAAAHLPEIGPADYEPDNTVELQMPLLRGFFPEASVVVAGVPASEVALRAGQAAVVAAAALGRAVVVVGSTDLTHYGPNYGFAPAGFGPEAVRWARQENDGRAIALMRQIQPETLLGEALERHFCCCPGAAAAALSAARERGATEGILLASSSSYDVRPDDSFVGYAALVA